MISPSDLAIMQQAMAPLRTTPCTLLRNTPTSDGMGGQTDNWQTLAMVQGRVTPVIETGREVIDEQRLEVLNRWLIYFPAGQDVTERDRIVANGATYEVTSVNTPRTISIETIVEAMRVLS